MDSGSGALYWAITTGGRILTTEEALELELLPGFTRLFEAVPLQEIKRKLSAMTVEKETRFCFFTFNIRTAFINYRITRPSESISMVSRSKS